MNPTTYDAIVQGVDAFAKLAAASGIVGALYQYAKSKGVDLQALAHNNLIGAAERAGQAFLTDTVLQGKSPTDPAVIADVAAAVKASLLTTHNDTINTAKASDADVGRIAANAVKNAVPDVQTIVSTPATPSLSGSHVAEAVATINAAKTALASLTPPAGAGT